jgi:hypothetical protein
MYLMERDLDRKIGAYVKAGRDPLDLFDPSKPDIDDLPLTTSAAIRQEPYFTGFFDQSSPMILVASRRDPTP